MVSDASPFPISMAKLFSHLHTIEWFFIFYYDTDGAKSGTIPVALSSRESVNIINTAPDVRCVQLLSY